MEFDESMAMSDIDKAKNLQKKCLEMIDHSAALQRAIEYHCKGKEIPDEILKDCPHHGKMLNDRLTQLRNLFLG